LQVFLVYSCHLYVWGNVTFDSLKNDAAKALNILIEQPEVDPDKISELCNSILRFNLSQVIICTDVGFSDPPKPGCCLEK
jgi:hypothetical protein